MAVWLRENNGSRIPGICFSINLWVQPVKRNFGTMYDWSKTGLKWGGQLSTLLRFEPPCNSMLCFAFKYLFCYYFCVCACGCVTVCAWLISTVCIHIVRWPAWWAPVMLSLGLGLGLETSGPWPWPWCNLGLSLALIAHSVSIRQ